MSGQISPLNPAQLTLDRLLPRLEFRFASAIESHPGEWKSFRQRLQAPLSTLVSIAERSLRNPVRFLLPSGRIAGQPAEILAGAAATLKDLDA